MTFLQQQNERLKTNLSPKGALSFQTAKTPGEATVIMEAAGVQKLKNNTYLDFAFIAAYAVLMYLCCKSLMQNFPKGKARLIGFIFLELSLAIAAFDILENIVMLMTLSGNGSKLSVTITRYACYAKWGMAILVLLYIFVSSVLLIISRVKKDITKNRLNK